MRTRSSGGRERSGGSGWLVAGGGEVVGWQGLIVIGGFLVLVLVWFVDGF